jgi:hypothetical protein
LTSPHETGVTEGVHDLMDRLQSIDQNFPLRFVPLRIEVFYTPVKERIANFKSPEKDLMKQSLPIQEKAIAAWTDEIHRRFSKDEREKPICDVHLERREA